jgi:hypothetical protein
MAGVLAWYLVMTEEFKQRQRGLADSEYWRTEDFGEQRVLADRGFWRTEGFGGQRALAGDESESR